MRIAVMSDLHLESDARVLDGRGEAKSGGTGGDFYSHPPPCEADVIVLAGDIHGGARGIDWAAQSLSLPVVFIHGNHETYGREPRRVIAGCRQRAGATGRIVFLERTSWTFTAATGERARFIGTSLWTDFRLDGHPRRAMKAAREHLEDFRVIKIGHGGKLRQLEPADTVRWHRASVRFLRAELERAFDGFTVVVTHHAPSPRSIASEFAASRLNPAFVSDLDDLIKTYQPSLWIHGHVHTSFDYRIGRTQVVCNPRGYFPDQLNPEFDPQLVVEIGDKVDRRSSMMG